MKGNRNENYVARICRKRGNWTE